MSRSQAWFFHLANALVSGTGLVYAWMLYLMEPEDEFSILNHPWQGHVLHAHLWTAPLLVFAGGMLWHHHAWTRFRQGKQKKRRSGMMLGASLFPMIFSGVFLQTAVEPTWRGVWKWVHLVCAALWLIAAILHPWLQARGEAKASA
ncbi:MAG: hypothetical protein DWQ01_10450 [Planctomycetota bacterium]|nr:MAG: hypothetical protein DWQ01_10450 [Planctomycetota bacterium]